MSNKKGMSDVVTTVLIVLLSLIAVTLVWTFLSPLILKSGADITRSQACMSVNLEVTGCKINSTGTQGVYNVTVKRSAGAASLSAIKLIFAKADGTTNSSDQNSSLPGELDVKFYQSNVGVDYKNVVAAAGISDAKGITSYCNPSQLTPINCVA